MATSAGQEFRRSLKLLATRRFGTFWLASLLSNIGSWAQQVAEPWLLLSLGASPLLLGVHSFAMNAPIWALTLAGGALADRADRRRIIALFQSIQMLCPTLIVLLLLIGRIHPLIIIALSLVVGVTDALSMPSYQSIVPSIVPRAEISRGLALNSTQFNLSRILGPAVAGVLMASFGAVACFSLSAASYIPFIGVALLLLPRGRSARQRMDLDASRLFSDVLRTWRIGHLRGALLTVFATSVLCGPLVTFIPVLVLSEFHGGSGDFSAAVGAFGVGGVVGAIGLMSIPLQTDRRRLSSAFAVGYGLVVGLIALAPWFASLPVLMVMAGAMMTMSNTSANSLLQSNAPPGALGQTVSLFMLATRGGQPLGALLTGLSIEALGVRPALALNALLAVAVQLTIARRWSRSPTPAEAQVSIQIDAGQTRAHDWPHK